jgi:hypothetical protein
MRYTIFAVVVWIIFTVFVTVFSLSADRKEVRLLPKFIWVLLCLLVPVVGGVLYLTVGRPVSGPSDSGSFGRQPRTRTVAPDDDPKFLRDLAERLRKQAENDNDEDGDAAK